QKLQQVRDSLLSSGRSASLTTHIHELPAELFDAEEPPDADSIRVRAPASPSRRGRGSPPHSSPSSPPPPTSPPPRPVDLGRLVHRHEVLTVPIRLQTHASEVQMDPATGRCTFALLAFHGAYVGSRGQAGARAMLFGLPTRGRAGATADVQAFRMDPLVGLDAVCLGRSGRRAVWLERNWETDVFALVKADFGAPAAGEKRQPVVAPLLPPHLALPFEAHACQSLAFDEARGRPRRLRRGRAKPQCSN
ncbi:hypothetical protein HDZ31DRAFT_78171, partial [Schizophyllum fasciatum]